MPIIRFIKLLFLTLLLHAIVANSTAHAQMTGLQWRNGSRTFEIPFSYVNHFIVVDLYFENIFAVKFIFDTGSEHTILTQRNLADILRYKYDRTFRLIGSDLQTELTAYVARNALLNVPNSDRTPILQDILVLEEDYFRFDEYVGMPIHGILGADVFGRFVVTIDYERQKIILHDPAQFQSLEQKKGVSTLPIAIHNGKPYLNAQLQLNPSDSNRLKIRLLLDTGASLALLLHRKESGGGSVRLPVRTVKTAFGRGLGGALEGIVGRVPSLQLAADISLRNLVVGFQEIPDTLYDKFLTQRDGIIGNQIFSRFRVTIDYINERLFLEPTKTLQAEFPFDRSGLVITASGKNLGTFTVQYVVAGSPAALANIQTGDTISKIGYLPAFLYDLDDLQRKLSGKVGKSVALTIRRGDKKLKVRLMLRDLI